MITFVDKKDGEVNIIASTRLLPNEDVFLGKFQEMSGKLVASSRFHRCAKLKKFLLLPVYSICRVLIFKRLRYLRIPDT